MSVDVLAPPSLPPPTVYEGQTKRKAFTEVMDYPPELIEDQKYELSHYDKLVKIGEGTFG
jgi:hypothetical protein